MTTHYNILIFVSLSLYQLSCRINVKSEQSLVRKVFKLKQYKRKKEITQIVGRNKHIFSIDKAPCDSDRRNIFPTRLKLLLNFLDRRSEPELGQKTRLKK